MRKIKVLIVDDSALVRHTLTRIFSADPALEVTGAVSDPYVAVNRIREVVPDVITLDVEMPRMDGLTFLKKIMSQHPMPVIIISTLTERGKALALEALEYGAVDVVCKPKINSKEGLENMEAELCEKVKEASLAKVKRKIFATETAFVKPKLSADVILSKPRSRSLMETTEIVIAVGASTGGTEAIRTLLAGMPEDAPGIIIVQHMPEMFTKQFARRLNEMCRVTVKEAEHRDAVLRGRALIAPGNAHMILKRSGANYYVEVNTEGPLVNRHKPSVDVLFRSVASYAGRNAIGIIMTGMGDDGARGLLEMRDAGAYTIAQDEKSSVVFGMPREAIKLNAVDKVLPLDDISEFLIKKLKTDNK